MEQTGPSKKELNEWLKRNVTTYHGVQFATLFGFSYDTDEYNGRFRVKFNSTECEYDFRFFLGECDGYPHVQFPIVHSPLGVPASFGAINIEDNVRDAIEREIRSLFPRIIPCGRDKSSGMDFYSYTPFLERVHDMDVYLRTIEMISEPEFESYIDLSEL